MVVVAHILVVQSLMAQTEDNFPLADAKLVKFYVADGRLSCIVKTRQNQRQTRESELFPRQHLTIDAGSSPSVRLVTERQGGQRTEVEFRRGEVTISLRGAIKRDLQQDSAGIWHVSIQDGTESEYPSFWHLLLGERAVSAELVPVLQLLRPHWGLDRQLAETTRRLVESKEDVVSVELVQRWVNELASNDFSARRNADSALRAYGQQILPILRQLDPMRLDAEQRRRIQRIIRASNTDREDDISRMVNRFSGDVWVWCHFLDAQDESVRELAHQRIATIVGRPISFDAKAEREIRTGQIARIQRDWQVR